jgi:magnesium transporter
MRARFMKRRSHKAGMPPGSLIHIGEQRLNRTRLSIIDYGTDGAAEVKDATVEECAACKEKPGISWIDVEGIHDVDKLEKLGQAFGLHPLVMEDILNTDQRPKAEDYGDYIYIVLRMLCFDDKKNEVVADQVSIILGKNFVLSFQEGELDVFEPLRKGIREGKGRVRKMGADYLAYALVDAIVDNFFVIFEKFGDEIDLIEDELIANPSRDTLQRIYRLKRDMLFLRKSVWPLRELVAMLERGESDLVGDPVRMYLRDVHDHAVYLVDTIETFRDMLSGMLDIYLSSMSNRMNEVMKVLTIIATIFMPLTFIAGVYGMNFEFMPELRWRYGYPAVLALMAGAAGAMLVYFRRKQWI